MTIKSFKKGEIIQHTGQLNTQVYIVQSGLLLSYMIDSKGKEHVYMFAPENWIIADSCLPTEPSTLFIDALEDSELVIRPKNPASEKEIPKLIKRLSVLQNRILMLMSATALERLEDFERTYPQLLQRIPQKMIASYLGVTPERLSHIRGSRTKKS